MAALQWQTARGGMYSSASVGNGYYAIVHCGGNWQANYNVGQANTHIGTIYVQGKAGLALAQALCQAHYSNSAS